MCEERFQGIGKGSPSPTVDPGRKAFYHATYGVVRLDGFVDCLSPGPATPGECRPSTLRGGSASLRSRLRRPGLWSSRPENVPPPTVVIEPAMLVKGYEIRLARPREVPERARMPRGSTSRFSKRITMGAPVVLPSKRPDRIKGVSASLRAVVPGSAAHSSVPRSAAKSAGVKGKAGWTAVHNDPYGRTV